MKILLVNTFHYHRGGDCTYTFSLADLLKKGGNEVYFWGMHHPLNYDYKYSDYFVDYIDFVEMNKNKNPLNAIKVIKRSIYSKNSQKNISQYLDLIKPDIAHFQNIHAHLTPSIIYEFKKRDIPIVWTLHDYKLICPNTHLLSNGKICNACKGSKFMQCTLKKCKKNSRAASLIASLEAIVHKFIKIPQKVEMFIAPSVFMLNKFIEFGWDRKKIIHLRNFLLGDNFVKSNDNSKFQYALYLGQLEPWKGVSTLIKAASIVKDIPVRIVGDGTIKMSLEKEALSIANNYIKFDGYLKGRDLKNALENCSFIVVPSEWYENCPYSVMEAMALGKPVIASSIGGLPELVENGRTGFLFEPENHTMLAEKMEALYSNNELRSKMGNKSIEKAKQEFNSSIYYKNIFSLYTEML